jgi:hypothetical protein
VHAPVLFLRGDNQWSLLTALAQYAPSINHWCSSQSLLMRGRHPLGELKSFVAAVRFG